MNADIGFRLEDKRLWQERLDDLEVVRQTTVESRALHALSSVGDGNKILVKLESDQKIKSFKIRGTTLAMANDLARLRRCGVVADSGGNHAQAVALAGRELGVPAAVVMADLVPENKKMATRNFGAVDGSFTLDTSPADFVTAKVQAKQLAKDKGMRYLSPYDDEAIIRGTATLVPETLGQLRNMGVSHLDGFHVPVGGGGLISGIADVNAEQGRLFRLFGHGMTGADSAARSLRAPAPVPVEGTPNALVEGLAVKVIGDRAHERMKAGKIDEIYTVELGDVGRAYKWYRENVLPALEIDTENEESVAANMPEVSSMVAVAGMFEHLKRTGARNETHLVLISGGNTDFVKMQKAMDAA